MILKTRIMDGSDDGQPSDPCGTGAVDLRAADAILPWGNGGWTYLLMSGKWIVIDTEYEKVFPLWEESKHDAPSVV